MNAAAAWAEFGHSRLLADVQFAAAEAERIPAVGNEQYPTEEAGKSTEEDGKPTAGAEWSMVGVVEHSGKSGLMVTGVSGTVEFLSAQYFDFESD